MDVSDIIKLAKLRAFDGVDIKPPVDDVYLTFLNMVHFYIYSETAMYNWFLNIESRTLENMGESFFKIIAVLSNNRIIPRVSTVYGMEKKHISPGSTNDHWFLANRRINVSSKQDSSITILYIAEPTPFTINTESIDIPYPPAFHKTLLDGLVFQILLHDTNVNDPTLIGYYSKSWTSSFKSLIMYLSQGSEVVNKIRSSVVTL